MGANGVCSVLATFQHEVPIAAAAVVAGPTRDLLSKEVVRCLARVPMYVAYGKNDSKVRPNDCELLVDELTQCRARVECQTYSDPNNAASDAHERACHNAFSQPFLYEWLLRHNRETVNVRAKSH
jgi:hypothetical protein